MKQSRIVRFAVESISVAHRESRRSLPHASKLPCEFHVATAFVGCQTTTVLVTVVTIISSAALLLHPLQHILTAAEEAEIPGRLSMTDAAAEIPGYVALCVMPVVFISVAILGLGGVHAV